SNYTVFAGFLLPLFASVHRILCADISAQILYDICNSSLCAINYLRRSLRMTSLCLACAVGRPHFLYSKGSFSFCSIDYSLLLNHSPSEWFSLYKKMRSGDWTYHASRTAHRGLIIAHRVSHVQPRKKHKLPSGKDFFIH